MYERIKVRIPDGDRVPNLAGPRILNEMGISFKSERMPDKSLHWTIAGPTSQLETVLYLLGESGLEWEREEVIDPRVDTAAEALKEIARLAANSNEFDRFNRIKDLCRGALVILTGSEYTTDFFRKEIGL